jgi:chromosome segregation ATPase
VDPATVNLINISKNITEFQRRHQADMTRLQAALRSADEKQQKLSDMDTQLDQLQEQTNSLESTRMEQVGAIKRLEQQVRLCVKESQFLKEQLVSVCIA